MISCLYLENTSKDMITGHIKLCNYFIMCPVNSLFILKAILLLTC